VCCAVVLCESMSIVVTCFYMIIYVTLLFICVVQCFSVFVCCWRLHCSYAVICVFLWLSYVSVLSYMLRVLDISCGRLSYTSVLFVRVVLCASML